MKPRYRSDDVRVVEFTETRVAVLEHRGDLELIGDSIRRFIEWRKQNHLPPRVSATFNVVWHHPVAGDEGECRYDLCAATECGVPENSYGVVEKIIPGGRCALLRHVGSEEQLGDAVHYLYTQWLPQSGEELRDFPLYLQRVRFFPEVAEHEAVTDVFLPLK